MDNETTIQELKDIVNEFCEERDWLKFHNAKDLSIGVITEASELLEHFRWKSPEEIREIFENPEKKNQVTEEIADVLYFLLSFSQAYNIDLSAALKNKLEVNRKKYPVEKAKGNNKKYNEF